MYKDYMLNANGQFKSDLGVLVILYNYKELNKITEYAVREGHSAEKVADWLVKTGQAEYRQKKEVAAEPVSSYFAKSCY